MKNKKTISIFLASLMSVPTLTWGMPDVSKGMPKASGQNVNINGLTVYGDVKSSSLHHTYDTDTLYVAPRNTKQYKGLFSNAGASINCDDLHDMRQVTYRYPSPAELNDVLASTIPYSPAFEANFGVNARNNEMLLKISEMILKTSSYIEDHRAEYGAYQAAKEELDFLTLDKQNLELEEASAHKDLTTQLTLIDPSLSSENRAREVDRIRNDFRNKIREIALKKISIDQKLLPARTKYLQATRAWAPFRDELNRLREVETALMGTFDQMRVLAYESLSRSEAMLAAKDAMVVGWADVGYNIYDNEQSELRGILNQMNLRHQVVELPIFNVRMNPGIFVSRNVSKTENVASIDYVADTMTIPNNTQQILPSYQDPQDSSFKTDNGEEVHVLMSVLKDGFQRSGNFKSAVTLGARCGYPIVKREDMVYTDANGRTIKTSVDRMVYSDPNPDQPVFVQKASLKYNFYSKAEPMRGKCEIDTKKSESYYRNAGHKRSWSLFRGTRSHSWDDTKRTLNQNLGLKCDVEYTPTGANPAEAHERKVAFEQSLYDDMMAMYLIQFAKSYTIEKKEPPMQSGKDKPLSKIGNAVISLCGANMWCQVGNIVLKTLDEIGGVRHTGSTSHVALLNSKITKDFKLTDYLIAEGSSDIEMVVCVDRRQCGQ